MIFRSQKLNKILFEIIKAKGMINRWSCFHLLQSSFRRRSYMAAAPPPSTAIPSLRKSPCIDTLSAGKTVGLRLRGCSASENEKRSGFVKARAVGPHLLAEEIRFRLEGTTLDGTGRYRTGQGGYLGFPEDSHLGPKKIMVAVDVDEVLGNFVSALNRFIVDCYASNHSVSEYHVYEFFKIWNCSRGEADKRVHEFFKTPYFESGIHPIPGAQQVLQKLSRFCDLSIVTSRQNVIKDHTIKWIEKHFPGLFQEIHFGNHFALDGTSRPKSDICRSLGAKVLIDDNPRYAIECAEVGIRVLLFDYENSYPWSKTEATQQHPLITKVHNWEEVEHHLVSWTNS